MLILFLLVNGKHNIIDMIIINKHIIIIVQNEMFFSPKMFNLNVHWWLTVFFLAS